MFAQIDQIVYGTLPASFTVVYGIGKSHFTFGTLQTMRHEQEKLLGLEPLDPAFDKVVVDLDKGGADPVLGNTEQTTDQRHEGEKQADG